MRIFNENFNADAKFPIILNAPHGGQEIPHEIKAQSARSQDELLATADIGTDLLVSLDPQFDYLSARFARTVVDLNRAPFLLDPKVVQGAPKRSDAYLRAGYGVIPRFAASKTPIREKLISIQDANSLIECYHKPYHQRLKAMIEARQAQFGYVLLIDVHSAPATAMKGAQIVLGSDYGRSAAPQILQKLCDIFSGYFSQTAINDPFAGGYITQHYGRPSSHVHVVQIEISRSLIEDKFRTPKKEFLNQWSAILSEISNIDFEAKSRRFAAE